MKKLTIDEAWENCLRHWDWIIAHIDFPEFQKNIEKSNTDATAYIDGIKWEFFISHKIRPEDRPRGSCYFCEYDAQQTEGHHIHYLCEYCPGRLVDPDFSCVNKLYHYVEKPIEFRQKLIELNRERLTGKGSENEQ